LLLPAQRSTGDLASAAAVVLFGTTSAGWMIGDGSGTA
jgi:hypothetical protein